MRRFFFCKGDGRFRRISGPDLALRTCSGYATGPARLLAGGGYGRVERKGPLFGRPLDLRFERKFADGRRPDSRRARARGSASNGSSAEKVHAATGGCVGSPVERPARDRCVRNGGVRNEGERMTRTIILDTCPVSSRYIRPVARLFTRILRSFAPSLVRRY